MTEALLSGKPMGFDYQMNVGIWKNPDGESVILNMREYKTLIHQKNRLSKEEIIEAV